jgi:two-component system LytT family response regulator
MKAIIVDDELKGQDMLIKLIANYCRDVEVVATASTADDAYQLIIKHKPHLVFLDIEMPGASGFSLLDRFNVIDFQVIVTTAFNEYALKAIKHHVFDYLLKPVDIDELRNTVDSLKKFYKTELAVEQPDELHAASKLSFTGKIGIPVKGGISYFPVANIIRIESDGSYCTFYVTGNKRYVVSKGLKDYEDILPAKEFYRVHKSHLINIHKVTKYIRTDGNFLEMEDNSVIEIARRKKEEFLQIMNALI